MRIEVKGRNVEVDDELRARVEKRFDKIARQVADLARLKLYACRRARSPFAPRSTPAMRWLPAWSGWATKGGPDGCGARCVTALVRAGFAWMGPLCAPTRSSPDLTTPCVGNSGQLLGRLHTKNPRPRRKRTRLDSSAAR